MVWFVPVADDVDDVAAAQRIGGKGIGLDLELLTLDGGNVDDAAPVLRGVQVPSEEAAVPKRVRQLRSEMS
jgi:hypothetical protein